MPMDNTNRFMQILNAAHELRAKRKQQNMEERQKYPKRETPTPHDDRPIPGEHRAYLRAKVKELLSGG
jgi:hypothetical protein